MPDGFEFRVLDHTGDGLRLTWTPGDRRSVDLARELFAECVRKGHTMYRLGVDDERGERISQFDEDAPGILAVPRMVGG